MLGFAPSNPQTPLALHSLSEYNFFSFSNSLKKNFNKISKLRSRFLNTIIYDPYYQHNDYCELIQ